MPTKEEWTQIALNYIRLTWGKKYLFVLKMVNEHGISSTTVFRHIKAILVNMGLWKQRKCPQGRGLSRFPQSTLELLICWKKENPDLSAKHAQELLRGENINLIPYTALIYAAWRKAGLPVGKPRKLQEKEGILQELSEGFRNNTKFDPESVFAGYDLNEYLDLERAILMEKERIKVELIGSAKERARAIG
jgi:hypothetical protein